MDPLRPATRLILALATLSLVATFFLPLWEIQLWAPQYPEGLNMKIWLNRISGDFDIINGINHYIGMKSIKAEMFPEFTFMRPLVGAVIVLGLIPSLTGRRRWLYGFVAVLILGGALGLIDYYIWGYDYGHNLNPKAAISVPGMSYEPPIIGYKNLLNFVAYSGPDSGGYVFIGVGLVAFILAAWEWRQARASLSKK
jgi:copper chaperone NosL